MKQDCEHKEIEYVKRLPDRRFDYRCISCKEAGVASKADYAYGGVRWKFPLDFFPVYVRREEERQAPVPSKPEGDVPEAV